MCYILYIHFGPVSVSARSSLSSRSKFFTIKDNKTVQHFTNWHPELFLQTVRHRSDWEQDSSKGKDWGKFASLQGNWIFAISEN